MIQERDGIALQVISPFTIDDSTVLLGVIGSENSNQDMHEHLENYLHMKDRKTGVCILTINIPKPMEILASRIAQEKAYALVLVTNYDKQTTVRDVIEYIVETADHCSLYYDGVDPDPIYALGHCYSKEKKFEFTMDQKIDASHTSVATIISGLSAQAKKRKEVLDSLVKAGKLPENPTDLDIEEYNRKIREVKVVREDAN